ncbi:MAG: response regulator [Bacteroidales bacterium]|nr:response regulator [Bacteroidales bacterium]
MSSNENEYPTIFVVDDNEENLKILMQCLSNLEYNVVPLRSCEEMFRLIPSLLPDLILLDIMMPTGMDGYEAFRRLKENDVTHDIPVIFMRVLTETGDKVSGFNLEAVDYITKPIDNDELLSRIHTHLSISRLQKKLVTLNAELEEKVLSRTKELSTVNEQLQQEIKECKQKEKLLSISEKNLRELQNNVPVGIFRTTQKGQLLSINRAFIKMFGYVSEHELLNTNIIDLYAYPEEQKILLEKTNPDGIVNDYEIQLKRVDGTIFWASISFKLIKGLDEKEKFYDGIIVDVSERRKLKEKLINAKDKAEESDRIKTSFLANMSHEIRTPLNSILGFTELLQNMDPTANELKEFSESIRSSSDRLINTINDLIEISRIESGQAITNISDISINKLMMQLHDFHKHEAEKKQLKFDVINNLILENPTVITDGNMLESILANFIKNALKFTKKGFIEFGNYIKDNELIIYIKDSGIGIFTDKIDKIFDRFIQDETGDCRCFEGSGLGLTIAKAYADLLGYRIWVESEVGLGSTFYCSIPYTKDAKKTESITEQAIEYQAKSEINILIVEDDEINYRYLELSLLQQKFLILRASNGKEAVSACRNNPKIALVLMDIKLPELDGIEATRQIRRFNKNVPIIAQTAYAFVGDRKKAMNAGCTDYITKPIKKDDLLKMMYKYL